jgi:TonB family protein
LGNGCAAQFRRSGDRTNKASGSCRQRAKEPRRGNINSGGIDMTTLSAIAEVGAKLGRMTYTLRSLSDRLWRVGLGTLWAVVLGALFGFAASAQQNHEPQSEAAPPAATAPSPLVARLVRLQRYPPKARGVQGVVSLAFTIDRHGNVVSSRIVKSSGSTVLDAEALDLLTRAVPLPPRQQRSPTANCPSSSRPTLRHLGPHCGCSKYEIPVRESVTGSSCRSRRARHVP